MYFFALGTLLKSKGLKEGREDKAEWEGVFTVNGKMVDRPIIDRAKHVLALAKAAGIKIEGVN